MKKLLLDMLEGDIHFYPVIYEILPGVIVVVNLFGDYSSNVYAAKVSETGLFFCNFGRLINRLISVYLFKTLIRRATFNLSRTNR